MRFLAILFAQILFVSTASADGDPEAGASAYARDCAKCHRDPVALAAKLSELENPAAALDAFLARHRAPDPARRADIVAFLTASR